MDGALGEALEVQLSHVRAWILRDASPKEVA